MPLVVDASALAEYLLGTAIGIAAADTMEEHAGTLGIPHLAVVETASVLRGLVRSKQVSAERAEAALIDLADLPVRRWPAEPLLTRVWELRDNMSAYDATYVALAELLDADLLTADLRLSRAAKSRSSCRVHTLAGKESA